MKDFYNNISVLRNTQNLNPRGKAALNDIIAFVEDLNNNIESVKEQPVTAPKKAVAKKAVPKKPVAPKKATPKKATPKKAVAAKKKTSTAK